MLRCGRWEAIWPTSARTDVARCSVSLAAKALTGLRAAETRLHLIGSFFFFSFPPLTDRQGIPPPSVTTVNHLLCGLEPLRPVPTWACHGPLHRGTFPPLGGQQPACSGWGGRRGETGAWRGRAEGEKKKRGKKGEQTEKDEKMNVPVKKSCRIHLYLPSRPKHL